jgi:3,4-dihydroxy 2-butanone 4-phosphate synthase/GTP cyclohydrolase II
MKLGHWEPNEPVMVRVQASNEASEVLGAVSGQNELVEQSLHLIAAEGKGMLLLMRQREKCPSIIEMLRQQQGESNASELFKNGGMDQRDFGIGAQILRDMGISKIRAITQHPTRRVGLIGYGLEIVEHILM